MGISKAEANLRVVTLKLDGRLDALKEPSLRSAIDEQLSAGPTALVIDLADVEFVDSAGLAALVKGMKDARRDGGDLRLVSPVSADAMRVFKLTRFDQVFSMFDTADNAQRGW